jgi:outer membrane lipoprotein SlyB
MTRQLLLMLFLLLSVETGRSQDNSWIITIATGDTLSGCSLISLEGDSLRITWSGYPVSLPVESLRKLQYHRESEFWRGAFYGSVAGGIVGTTVGASGSGSESSAAAGGALGILTGFAAGGLGADYLSRDDRYDLQKYDSAEKKNIIKTLLPQSELHLGGEKPK